MKRILAGLVLLILLTATAQAGGGGNTRLSRPVERVAVGTVPIYLQALQHDIYPVSDAKVKILGIAADGTRHEVTATLDPAYAGDNVYMGRFPFDRPGLWRLTVTANSQIHFPTQTFSVDVAPAGTAVKPLGPIRIMERGAAASTNRASTALVERPAPEPEYAPPPRRPVAAAASWLGAALVVAAGLMLLRHRRRPA